MSRRENERVRRERNMEERRKKEPEVRGNERMGERESV